MNNIFNEFDVDDIILKSINEIENNISDLFKEVEEIQNFNSYKVISSMQKANLSDRHFSWNTGYGYNDIGRETTEKIFANIFKTEDAIVRASIANGTHALSLCLEGILTSDYDLISISGKPYDTLDKVIGILDSYNSLIKRGVNYFQIELKEDGNFDIEEILNVIKNSQRKKMVYIQRSKGYFRRKALMIDDIKKIIEKIKIVDENVVVMVDNCYGEFMEKKEPTEVGADVVAGSLIKNPCGGFAVGGGYIVGKEKFINLIADRMIVPGIGKECGLTFGTTRQILQGLFIAPMIVSNAKKGAIFCAKLFEKFGFDTFPKFDDNRSDIIQAIGLRDEKQIINFCNGVQKAAPVDSFVKPEPWDMPGYDSKVIMAAGAFIQGSSIELSADAPIRKPYTVYFQGGLTYEHSKLGAILALNEIIRGEKSI